MSADEDRGRGLQLFSSNRAGDIVVKQLVSCQAEYSGGRVSAIHG
jgi:hypothetical protein